MLIQLFGSRRRKALLTIREDLHEIRQVLPELRAFLQLRSILDALGPHLATLDALGPHLATLDALGPHLATLDALGPRLVVIDKTFDAINNILIISDLVQQLRPIVDRYLEQNHLVAENVRIDVETISVMITSLQMQVGQLQDVIASTRQL